MAREEKWNDGHRQYERAGDGLASCGRIGGTLHARSIVAGGASCSVYTHTTPQRQDNQHREGGSWFFARWSLTETRRHSAVMLGFRPLTGAWNPASGEPAMARVARDDATVLFDIVESLLREKMYHSAEIVGSFLLSKSSVSQIGGLHAEALSMFADALKGRGEHKRATVRPLT